MEKILVIKDIQNNRKNKNIKINDYLLNIIKNLLDNNPKRYSIIDLKDKFKLFLKNTIAN